MGKINLSETEEGQTSEFLDVEAEEVTSIGAGLALKGEAELPNSASFSLVLNDTHYIFSDAAMDTLVFAVQENAERVMELRRLGIPNSLED